MWSGWAVEVFGLVPLAWLQLRERLRLMVLHVQAVVKPRLEARLSLEVLGSSLYIYHTHKRTRQQTHSQSVDQLK
jgi:hypothetical protein